MPDFGIFRGFNDKLFGDKLYAGQLPTQLGLIGSENVDLRLLDLYPNAAAAYSLRKLRTDYTGSAIEVRRTNLDVADIGFTSTGALDTAALLAFTGTGVLDNGFVTKWYDQSGNGRNATQATALNQPQIVSSGSVIVKGIKPAIDFNGTSHNLTTPDYLSTSLTQLFITSVIDAVNTTGLKEIFSHYNTVGNQRSFFYGIRDSNFSFNGSEDGTSNNLHRYDSSGAIVNDYLLYSAVVDTTISQKVQFYKNNSALASTSITPTGTMNLLYNSTADFEIGNGNYSGTIQELIFYPSDQSSNRTDIETNINDFYSIY
jgi:hypothetical protein